MDLHCAVGAGDRNVSLAHELMNGNAGVEDDENGDQELAAPRITEILTRFNIQLFDQRGTARKTVYVSYLRVELIIREVFDLA